MWRSWWLDKIVFRCGESRTRPIPPLFSVHSTIYLQIPLIGGKNRFDPGIYALHIQQKNYSSPRQRPIQFAGPSHPVAIPCLLARTRHGSIRIAATPAPLPAATASSRASSPSASGRKARCRLPAVPASTATAPGGERALSASIAIVIAPVPVALRISAAPRRSKALAPPDAAAEADVGASACVASQGWSSSGSREHIVAVWGR